MTASTSSRARTCALLTFMLPAFVAAQNPSPDAAAAQAGAPLSLTLQEAVRIGEARSEGVRIARAGVQRSQGQLLQARSQHLPQIFGSAGYTRTLASQFESFAAGAAPDTTGPQPPPGPCEDYLRDESAPILERVAGLEQASRCVAGFNPFAGLSDLPFGQENQFSFGFSLSQNLFSGGRVRAQAAAAQAGRRSADIELTAQRAQIVMDIVEAYYAAALADRLVSIAQASYAQTETVLRQTQLARTVGNVSEFELLRAQVSRDNQKPVVIQRQSDREVAYLRLKQMLEIPLTQQVRLTTAIDDSTAMLVDPHIPGLAFASYSAPDTSAVRRAAVRQATEWVRAEENLLRVARSQRIPSLSLTSQYGRVAYPRTGFPTAGDFRTNLTVGVAAQFPIFTGGRIRGDELVAQANVAEARARLQQVTEFAALDAQVALNALRQAASAYEASRGTAQQAARAYTIAEVRHREGISTQLELNDARLLLEQATANRALAVRNLQIARVRLALLPYLPLQSGTSAQAAAAQQQQQQMQQQTAPQQPQPQQQPGQQAGTMASQQIPGGF